MINVHQWLQSLVAQSEAILDAPPHAIMTNNFIKTNTDKNTFDEFVVAFRQNHAITGVAFDTYVRTQTKFDSWKDMFQTAYEETFLIQN